LKFVKTPSQVKQTVVDKTTCTATAYGEQDFGFFDYALYAAA